MRIKALIERKAGEWEEISVMVHPDYPDTGMFQDKDRKIKVLDIACGLTWGGRFISKSYREMIDIVKLNHPSIEQIKTAESRKNWLLQRMQAVIDAAINQNNQELIEYINMLSNSTKED